MLRIVLQVDADDIVTTQLRSRVHVGRPSRNSKGDDDVARHDGRQARSPQSIRVERFGKVHAAIINSISMSARVGFDEKD